MQSSKAVLPTWYRALALIVGLISIALAFVVLLYPGIALATVVLLLGFFFFVVGIDRVVAGVTGHPYGFMSGAGRGLVAEAVGEAPLTGTSPPSSPPRQP